MENIRIIVLFRGQISSTLTNHPDLKIEYLLGNYAIITLPPSLLFLVKSDPSILFVEEPRNLYPLILEEKVASCIPSNTTLSNTPCLIGIIDSGIDVTNMDFYDENGNTRIYRLWDQSENRIYTKEDIQNGNCTSIDLSGHGTTVARIAAGRDGVARNATLIVVKLSAPRNDFPSTIELMQAVKFCITESLSFSMPLAINISFGTTYGPHTGDTLLETYLDAVISNYGCGIAVGTGNEALSGGHASLFLSSFETKTTEFSIGPYESTLSLQIWGYGFDRFDAKILNYPGDIRISIEEATPYRGFREIFLQFLPANSNYLPTGTFILSITSEEIKDGRIEIWMPNSATRGPYTRFLTPNPNGTLTIPSCARSVISVGAYQPFTRQYASFSGRGFTYSSNYIKPDLVAPGIDIYSRSGTSFATPFVTGCIALLMQQKRELYGESLRNLLIQGAAPLPAYKNYPNPEVGWGSLCFESSLEKL